MKDGLERWTYKLSVKFNLYTDFYSSILKGWGVSYEIITVKVGRPTEQHEELRRE